MEITQETLDGLKFDAHGLMPAVVVDAETNEVLMVAYMNKDSLADTVKTGKTHFWSRSRQQYWMKGESSGNTQEVQDIYIDCDVDTIVVKVKPNGAACHKGYRSCFYRKLNDAGEFEVIDTPMFNPEDVYGKK